MHASSQSHSEVPIAEAPAEPKLHSGTQTYRREQCALASAKFRRARARDSLCSHKKWFVSKLLALSPHRSQGYRLFGFDIKPRFLRIAACVLVLHTAVTGKITSLFPSSGLPLSSRIVVQRSRAVFWLRDGRGIARFLRSHEPSVTDKKTSDDTRSATHPHPPVPQSLRRRFSPPPASTTVRADRSLLSSSTPLRWARALLHRGRSYLPRDCRNTGGAPFRLRRRLLPLFRHLQPHVRLHHRLGRRNRGARARSPALTHVSDHLAATAPRADEGLSSLLPQLYAGRSPGQIARAAVTDAAALTANPKLAKRVKATCLCSSRLDRCALWRLPSPFQPAALTAPRRGLGVVFLAYGLSTSLSKVRQGSARRGPRPLVNLPKESNST